MPPFDHAGRIARAREELDARGVDCLLLSVGSDLPYLTGYTAMPLERLTMLVLPRQGEAVLVVPELEAPRVPGGPVRVHPWPEREDPAALVAALAGRPRVAAIGDETWSVFLLELLVHMTDTTFVPASSVMRHLRARKEPAEVEALRRAAGAVDRVLDRIPAEVRFSGRSEREVARRVREMTVEEGHDEALFWIVASGPNAASPHHEPTDRVMGEGDSVVIDFGGRMGGYCSDVTRTFVVGGPDDELARVHGVVADAQVAAREAVAPGRRAEEVDRAAREVIEAAGLGSSFLHRVGHGIGMDPHEHPYLVEGNRERLEPGMAFSIEPGVYLPGRLGVRVEDIVVVVEDGVEVLNQANRALVAVE